MQNSISLSINVLCLFLCLIESNIDLKIFYGELLKKNFLQELDSKPAHTVLCAATAVVSSVCCLYLQKFSRLGVCGTRCAWCSAAILPQSLCLMQRDLQWVPGNPHCITPDIRVSQPWHYRRFGLGDLYCRGLSCILQDIGSIPVFSSLDAPLWDNQNMSSDIFKYLLRGKIIPLPLVENHCFVFFS